MTGYGKQLVNQNGKSIVIEIKSLNSKQLDLNTRIAPLFREKEGEIRNIVTGKLHRGKIDLSISIEKGDNPAVDIDIELAKKYFLKLSDLAKEVNMPLSSEIFIQSVKMPEVLISSREDLSDELWIVLAEAIANTCDKVSDFRLSEGKELARDLEKRVNLIEKMIDEVTPWEKKRVENLKNKFIAHLSALEVPYDKNRLEEEMIYFIEKLDITEEKVRLRKHCSYFKETMLEEANGKKLGFIIQEFGREINTMGAKANDFEIQQIVVKMKDELEKIKEQLANIL